MIIGVDALPAAKENKTGVEWFCFFTMRELIKLDRSNQYRLYTDRPLPAEIGYDREGVEQIILPRQRFWTHRALAWELKRRPVDVFFTPSHIVPWFHPRRTIFTLHDAGYRLHRKNYSFYQNMHSSLNTWSSVRWSSDIIVPTNFVLDDVSKIFNLEKKRLTVIPPGFEQSHFSNVSDDDVEAAKRQFGIHGNYIIFIGRLDHRKNVVRLLQAFLKVQAEVDQPIQCVLVGSPGVEFGPIDTIVKANPGLIIQVGYVDGRTKGVLLSGALLMAFPSLYEGFGVPILEGFASGTAVLTSDGTACAEVGGDAAVLVDPLNVDAIAAGMRSLICDAQLRATLVQRGLARVSRYSWARTAAEILSVIEAQR